MNILASHNWIKDYLKTKDSVEQFDEKMSLTGSSVEYIHRDKDLYNKMIVGEVKELKKHPNADALQIAMTDVGKKALAEIVCGGKNLKQGIKVVVALPGSKVRWHGEGELITLETVEVRGVKSAGMICAANELGFEKIAQGEKDIWIISSLTDAVPGTPIADALDLNDTIFDIEATTNRPDQMSIIGLAREGGTAGLGTFGWDQEASKKKLGERLGITGDELPLKVSVKDSKLCPRYQAVVIDGIKVGPSPWWLQKRLLQAGHRPYNNIVDITNYVLHEFGQPMHTFDYDKLEGKEIVVRKAKKGEKFLALDENEYELASSQLVIADKKRPVAVAGVMGGMDTGTTEKTKTIVFECASFEPVNVRRAARDLNLYSDSQLLFEKGLSTEATEPALMRAIELTLEIASGRVASKVFDERAGAYKPSQFPFDPKKASELIGVDIPEVQQMAILGNLGFTAKQTGGEYQITVPYWRDHDIEASVDFTEEIARVYGYHNLPSKLPEGELPDLTPLPEFVWERRLKDILCGAGATEMFSEPLISEADLKRYSLSDKDALHIANPLSVDAEYLRPNLNISMLKTIEANQREFPEGVLFELARAIVPQDKGLPNENQTVLLAVYGSDGEKAFLRAKGLLERMLREAGVSEWSFDRDVGDSTYWHSARSAKIMIDGKQIGVLGEVAQATATQFGLEARVSLVEINFSDLLPHLSIMKKYTQTPEFPAVKRDLAFVLDNTVEYSAVEAALLEVDSMIRTIELFDVYSGKGVKEDQKSLAVHLEFRLDDRTLKSEEVDAVVEGVVKMLKKEFHATIRA